jgi:hypothetical protein
MNNDLLIEIIKVLLPAIISSTLVTYIFQAKLRRLGTYENITNLMMERMLDGINDVFTKNSNLNRAVLELSDILNMENFDTKKFEAAVRELRRYIEEYTTSVQAHRFYITSLIPFGGSSRYLDTYIGIIGCSKLYTLDLDENGEVAASISKQDLEQTLEKAKKQYIEVCEKINDIKKRIMKGDIVV